MFGRGSPVAWVVAEPEPVAGPIAPTRPDAAPPVVNERAPAPQVVAPVTELEPSLLAGTGPLSRMETP